MPVNYGGVNFAENVLKRYASVIIHIIYISLFVQRQLSNNTRLLDILQDQRSLLKNLFIKGSMISIPNIKYIQTFFHFFLFSNVYNRAIPEAEGGLSTC